MNNDLKIRVLFVCMGNICRSPTAEGVFQNLIETEGLSERFYLDSAGTHAYHVSEAPDPRAQKAAQARGIDIAMIRARRVDPSDFEAFDYILAMDEHNYASLAEGCSKMLAYKLHHFMDFAPHLNTREVPDPYYGGIHGFDRVLDMVEDAAKGFLQEVREKEKI